MLHQMYSPEYQDFINRTGFKPWLFSNQAYSPKEKRYKLEAQLEGLDQEDKPMGILILIAHASVPAEIANKIYDKYIKTKKELFRYLPHIDNDDLTTLLASKLKKQIKDSMWSFILENKKQRSKIIENYVETIDSNKNEWWIDLKYKPPVNLNRHIWENILKYSKLNLNKGLIIELDHQALHKVHEYLAQQNPFVEYIKSCTKLKSLREALVFQLCACPLNVEETFESFWENLNPKFEYLKNNKIILELTGLELDENLKISIEKLLPAKTKEINISSELNQITY